MREIDQLEFFDKTISKEELERLIRATHIGRFGPNKNTWIYFSIQGVKMKVMILGKTGFIGQNLYNKMFNDGQEVIGVSINRWICWFTKRLETLSRTISLELYTT